MEFIIVSGLSGAGKSKVASILEDIGFYCVDNLPPQLIPKLAEVCMAGSYSRVALVTDVRGGQTFEGLFAALDALDELRVSYQILFVEATPEAIIKRYKETRRSHPLARAGRTLEEAVNIERAALEMVRARAEYILDTTALSLGKLRGEVLRLIQPGERPDMSISVLSFGFKYGIPIEADLVFDVRCLPNPYYIAGLREQTGLQEEVAAFLDGYQQTRALMERLQDLLAFLLPMYMDEGKTGLVIAVGCTGGRHRSVYMTRGLAEFLRQKGYAAGENHRDMTRGG